MFLIVSDLFTQSLSRSVAWCVARCVRFERAYLEERHPPRNASLRPVSIPPKLLAKLQLYAGGSIKYYVSER